MSQGMAQLYTVIGAGVVGLTTALEIARRGHYVRVVAEHMPGEFHPDYTSPWAGAHWRSMAEPDETLQVGKF
jgi:D-amino-acid oxidase